MLRADWSEVADVDALARRLERRPEHCGCMRVGSGSIVPRPDGAGAPPRTPSCGMATPTASHASRSRPPSRSGPRARLRHARESSALPPMRDGGRQRTTPVLRASWLSVRSTRLRGCSDARPRQSGAARASSESPPRAQWRTSARASDGPPARTSSSSFTPGSTRRCSLRSWGDRTRRSPAGCAASGCAPAAGARRTIRVRPTAA